MIALNMIPDRSKMTLSYEVVSARSPAALGFDPAGLSHRGSSTCPLCGASVGLDHVQKEAEEGRLGAELMAVGLLPLQGRGKTYIGSVAGSRLVPDEERLSHLVSDLIDQGLEPPHETIVPHGLGIRVPRYGMTTFADLFTRRQLVLLLTLCRLARESHVEMIEAGVPNQRAAAVATYLGLLVDRMADFNSQLCRWEPNYEKTQNTFSRQALSMTWDFSEVNPFGGSSGDLAMHLDGIAKVIEHCALTGSPTRVVRGSATSLPFEDGEFDAVITDPPYYDNVGYADISDFFYVWLKRSIATLHPAHLVGELTPKRSEIVASPDRHEGSVEGAKQFYESMMAEAFAEARRVLKSDGVMVCVYAHQTTAGWSTLIEAIRLAGFVVVEAWPLDTEMPTRGRAQGSAALASSIFLVARPRGASVTGDWANQVRPELAEIVEKRVDELPQLGVTGTDLVIASVGAGMRAYTRYARVEKPNGEELLPEEYLNEVEREVAEAVLARIFKTDRQGLGRVDQATQFYVMGRFEFSDALVPWDELNTLARGTGVELNPLARGPHALVAFGDKRDKARLRDYLERGDEPELGLDGSRSTVDHLHRILWLAESQPNGVSEYLSQARPDAARLRLVAHALARPGLDTSAAGSPEAEACERLLAVWHRLIDDNLFSGSSA